MIQKVRSHALRSSELLQFLIDVTKLCSQQSNKSMKLDNILAELKADTDSFDQAFRLDQASAITIELINLDGRRDECITGISLVIDGFTRYFEPVVKAAALALKNNLDKYGNRIYEMNYQAETSTINSLIKEWSTNGILKAAVNTLNLGIWVNELKKANDLFNERYLKRVDEKASAPQIKGFDARKKAISVYRKLVQQIEARAIIAEDQTYTGLINNLNALIVKYNIIADSHAEKKEEIA